MPSTSRRSSVRTLIMRDFDARLRDVRRCSSCPTSPTVAFKLGGARRRPARDVRLPTSSRCRSTSPACPGLSIPCGLQRGTAGRAAADRPAVSREQIACRADTRWRAPSRSIPCQRGARGPPVTGVPEGWEAVIGLEIHVQLKRARRCSAAARTWRVGEPNTRICPVCMAHPGVLPVPNRSAVEKSILVGIALGSRSRTARSSPQELLLSRLAEGRTRSPSTRSRCASAARWTCRARTAIESVALRACAPRGGRREDHPRGRRLGTDRRLDRLGRRLQPLRHALARDRDRARPAHSRGGEALPVAPEGDHPGDRRLGLRHGEGLAPLRRQRLGARARASTSSGRRRSSRT